MTDHARRLAAELRRPGTLGRRQGVVSAVNTDGTIDVTIGGSTVVVGSIAAIGWTPVGSSVWLLDNDGDLLAVGSTGQSDRGPILLNAQEYGSGQQSRALTWDPDNFPKLARYEFTAIGSVTATGTARMRLGANGATATGSNYRGTHHGRANGAVTGAEFGDVDIADIGNVRSSYAAIQGVIVAAPAEHRYVVTGQMFSTSGGSTAQSGQAFHYYYNGNLDATDTRLDRVLFIAPTSQTWSSLDAAIWGYPSPF